VPVSRRRTTGVPNGEFSLRKILVATDFSEPAAAALRRAVRLGEQAGAEVTVAHVIEHVAAAVAGTSFEAHWRIPAGELRKAERRLRGRAGDRLAALTAPYRGGRSRLRTETLVGVAFVEIIRAVQRVGYDLVLAGTRGLSGFRRYLVGSTAERLVRQCPCPVWVVKPGYDGPLRSILAPVDFSEVSGTSLQVAACLARLSACPLDVLHVLSAGDDGGPFPDDAARPDLRSLRTEVRQAAAQHLDSFVGVHVHPDVAVRERLAVGTPWKTIGVAARRVGADLIVLGSVGRTGVPGLLIGNTAEKVLRHCGRSVLAVKPDDFVSPVR
jgi:universal stress protein E